MTNAQLIDRFSKAADISLETAKEYFDIFMQCVEDGLRLDGRLQIRNYFTIWVKQFESQRDYINPTDGKMYHVGRKQRLKIKPSTAVKKLLDNSDYYITHMQRE